MCDSTKHNGLVTLCWFMLGSNRKYLTCYSTKLKYTFFTVPLKKWSEPRRSQPARRPPLLPSQPPKLLRRPRLPRPPQKQPLELEENDKTFVFVCPASVTLNIKFFIYFVSLFICRLSTLKRAIVTLQGMQSIFLAMYFTSFLSISCLSNSVYWEL